jgi:hypothetical protein
MGARWKIDFLPRSRQYLPNRSRWERLKKWELAKILTDASMNGGDRLAISLDSNALLMDVDCGSEHKRKNGDGPQPAIERLDISADEAMRIWGKDDYVGEPFWLTAKEFLCIIQKENEKPGVNLPDVFGRRKSEADRETRANADGQRATKLRQEDLSC